METWKFCGESGGWTSFKPAFKSHLYEVFKQWILCHYNYDLSLLVPNMRWNWVGNALPIITGHTLECFPHYFNLESGGGYVVFSLGQEVLTWICKARCLKMRVDWIWEAWILVTLPPNMDYNCLRWLVPPKFCKVSRNIFLLPYYYKQIQQFPNNLQSQNWYKCYAKA